jgi:predicted CXXCH cytochrome family protein
MPSDLHECPHCHEKRISSFQKLFSVTFSPAVCPVCHKESNVPIVHGLITLTVWIILTWLFIGLAILAQMSFFLLGTIPAFIVCVNKYLLAAPLEIRETGEV